jgi:hypothetical protein
VRSLHAHFVLPASAARRRGAGLLSVDDIQRAHDSGLRMPKSRKLLAVPFMGKDVPTRASEFSHPDVVIGLSILAFRHEGLRRVGDVIYGRGCGSGARGSSFHHDVTSHCSLVDVHLCFLFDLCENGV